jgi:hypothetical protein
MAFLSEVRAFTSWQCKSRPNTAGRDLDEAHAAIGEARVMQSLPPHPGMIQCLDLWMATDISRRHSVNILMEYCAGGDLHDYVYGALPLPHPPAHLRP